MQHRLSHIALFSLVLISLPVLAGCGGKPLTTISGNVTLDGQPLQSGSIQFIPKGDKGTTEGGNIVDGKYTATVSAGKNDVKIFASKDHPTKTMPNAEPGQPPIPVKVSIIPQTYNDNTTLSIDVTGSGEHNFDLKSKP